MRAHRQRNLSRHQKIFLQKRLSHKGYPLWDRTIFGQVFVRGAMNKISKWKVPPTGGARHNRPRAHARFSEIRRRRASPDPLTDELDHVEKPALDRWSCRSLLGLPSSPQHVSGRVARAEPVGLSASRFDCAINAYNIYSRRREGEVYPHEIDIQETHPNHRKLDSQAALPHPTRDRAADGLRLQAWPLWAPRRDHDPGCLPPWSA